MYLKCISEETVMRQHMIGQTLLDMMQEQPYDKIRVGEICEKANVSRRLFYRYFGCKDGALSALIDNALMEHTQYTIDEGIDLSDINSYMVGIFKYWKNQSLLLDVLYNNGLDGIYLERALNYGVNDDTYLRKCLEYGGMPCDTEAITFAINGITSVVLNWHHGGFQKTPQEMGMLLKRLLCVPLLTPFK